jgi:hypothetical protein
MIALLAVVAALDAGAAPVPMAASLRDARQVLADYAKAIGDQKAWQRHKSVRVTREVSIKSMNFRSQEETRLTRSGKLLSSSSMPGMGKFRRGYDGRVAWGEDPISGLRVLKGAEADEVRAAAIWNLEWRLEEVYAPVRAVDPPVEAPKGAPLECVELSRASGKPTLACFDKATHLRVWEKGEEASPGGAVPYVKRFSDWRTVEGVQVWFHETVTSGPLAMEGQIVDIRFDEPMRPELFALPVKH